MDASASSVSLISQSLGYPSAQTRNTPVVTPLERLRAAKGMDGAAMQEMLAPSSSAPASNTPLSNTSAQSPIDVAFNAQAQVIDSQQNVTGRLVDIFV